MSADGGRSGHTITAAVIGCGEVSGVHIDALVANPDISVVAVCDADPSRLGIAAQRLSCPGYDDYLHLLDAERPDVVHICTPHHLHADMAIACLERGVNVLLEKPMASTVVGAQRVIEAADCSTAQLGVCFQNRYNPTSRVLREVLDDGRFGAVRGARASVTWSRDAAYYLAKPWRGKWASAGGGVLINQAVHTLDLLQWFLGDVTEVRGTASTLLLGTVIEVEDTASMALTHQGGRRSLFYASNCHVENSPVTIEILTESATLLLETDLVACHPDGRREVLAEQQVVAGEKAYWGASHALLIDDFYRQVGAGRPFWIDAREAAKSLTILTAVYDQSQLPGREQLAPPR